MITLLLLPLIPFVAATEAVWVEGESDTIASTYNQHNWYSDVDETLLSPGVPGQSAGGWAAHFANNDVPVEATWAFDVAEAGTHTIWARVGSYRVGMWASVDAGDALDLDLDDYARETVNLVYPSIDVRFISWVKVGDFDLDAGAHELTMGLTSHPDWAGAETYGGVDAFVVTNVPRWAPTGALQPEVNGEAEGQPDAWFPFLPKEESTDFDSAMDRSSLLERPAGTHGPLTRDGSALAFADATHIKLWGVNVGEVPGTDELRERQARFWARQGVNAVRLHSVQNWLGTGRNADGSPAFDPDRLDALDHWFSVLSEQGIYSCWSVFYPFVLADTDAYPDNLRAELSATTGGRSTSGLVTIRPELQDAETAWVTALLAHRNPYTGKTYAEDAALAAVELRNEDSIFWHWPLNGLADGSMPEHTAELQADWAEWLKGRYADDAALIAAWGPEWGGRRPGDSLNNPAMPIYAAWEMAADGPLLNASEAVRMGDFIRFLAEIQRDGYERRAEALRAAGYNGLLISTAWMAGGDAAHLANAWTDSALGAIDRHAYQGGGAGDWRITTGSVDAWTHFDHPGEGLLDMAASQVDDHPLFMTEWDMRTPDPWAAEAAPIEAFYGLGLQGWDASFHFAASGYTWEGGWPDNYSYVSETPHYMGLFPALSTAVLEGHIQQGAPAAVQRVSMDAAMSGVDARVHPPAGAGFNGSDNLEVPAAVALLGRVSHAISDDPPEAADWGDLTGVIQSLGGELSWDVPNRYATVQAPMTQGIIGFGGGRTHTLPDVTVALDTDYAVVLLTALDGQPIASSARMLVTAVARDIQTGAAYNADYTELESVGGPPLLLEPVQADLTIPGIVKVTALDVDGWPRVEVPITDGTAGTFRIDGRWRTDWYLVEREIPDDSGVNDSGSGDSGSDGSGGTDAQPGCGCATTAPSGAGSALLGLLAVVGLARRSRR